MPFLTAAKGLRQAIALVAACVATAIVFCSVVLSNINAEEAAKPFAETVSSKEALARLEQGNRRCVEGKSAHGHDQERWRERFLVKQKPFATVLGCSDSRVSPELFFDQGFGELFVIHVAGNIVDLDVVGSIQYAVEHLDNKLWCWDTRTAEPSQQHCRRRIKQTMSRPNSASCWIASGQRLRPSIGTRYGSNSSQRR